MNDTCNKDGFHLIEVLVVTGLSSLVMVGTMGLSSSTLRANAHSSRMTSAVTLVQDMVDDLRDRRFSKVASGSDTDSSGIFERSWVVTTNGSTKHVDVTVQWLTTDQIVRQVTLSTITARE